jgi:hypothetical protein
MNLHHDARIGRLVPSVNPGNGRPFAIIEDAGDAGADWYMSFASPDELDELIRVATAAKGMLAAYGNGLAHRYQPWDVGVICGRCALCGTSSADEIHDGGES